MKKIYLVLDNIRSALNTGAIFRTADGLNVSEVILVGITPRPPHAQISKTALDAQKQVAWKHFKDRQEAIEYLNEKNTEIICVEITKDAKSYFEEEYSDNIALVFGHELTGVSLEFLNASIRQVYIPMLGSKKSLNVATTVGIVTSFVRFIA